jgi:hypothetical protein
MFEQPLFMAVAARAKRPAQMFSEFVATFGPSRRHVGLFRSSI